MILSRVGTLQNEVKSCNLGRVWIPLPPKNIIDNHSRLSQDLKKHTRNGHLGKVPGGFEPGTPGSPVQHTNHWATTAAAEPMENLWYLCSDLLIYTVASPDPDPNPRGGGQLPNPKSAILC